MRLCELCRAVLSDPRAKYCGGTCRSRASWLRRVTDGQKWLALPEGRFTSSPEMLLLPDEARAAAFLERTIVENAPKRAVGYRIGTAGPQSEYIRWFPSARRRHQPWFQLSPFEPPGGPFKAKYAVLYIDEKGQAIDESTFTIWVERVASYLDFIDGDRGMTPRRRPG